MKRIITFVLWGLLMSGTAWSQVLRGILSNSTISQALDSIKNNSTLRQKFNSLDKKLDSVILRDNKMYFYVEKEIVDSVSMVGIVSSLRDTLINDKKFLDSIFSITRDSLLLDRKFSDSIFAEIRDSLILDKAFKDSIDTHLDSIAERDGNFYFYVEKKIIDSITVSEIGNVKTLYNADGRLSGERRVNMDNHKLTFDNGNIGVGTVPDDDAIVDFFSNNKGVRLPRVTLTSTTSPSPLSDHKNGMLVYNTATTNDVSPGLYINDGSKWALVSGKGGGGSGFLRPGEMKSMYFRLKNSVVRTRRVFWLSSLTPVLESEGIRVDMITRGRNRLGWGYSPRLVNISSKPIRIVFQNFTTQFKQSRFSLPIDIPPGKSLKLDLNDWVRWTNSGIEAVKTNFVIVSNNHWYEVTWFGYPYEWNAGGQTTADYNIHISLFRIH